MCIIQLHFITPHGPSQHRLAVMSRWMLSPVLNFYGHTCCRGVICCPPVPNAVTGASDLFVFVRLQGGCACDPTLRMYEVMSGKGPSPKTQPSAPEPQPSGDGGLMKIIKVCFCTNNNLGKNFKLVKCDSSWQVRVSPPAASSLQSVPELKETVLKSMRRLLRLLKAIIRSILVSGRLGPNVEHVGSYGLLLKHLKSAELHWLHPDLTVGEVEQRYESHHVEAEWR